LRASRTRSSFATVSCDQVGIVIEQLWSDRVDPLDEGIERSGFRCETWYIIAGRNPDSGFIISESGHDVGFGQGMALRTDVLLYI